MIVTLHHDEIIGCGGKINTRNKNNDGHVVVLTSGDFLKWKL